MKVFVTGASGFIGSQAARALVADGCEVHALTRPGSSAARTMARWGDAAKAIKIIPGDLANPESYANALVALEPDACLHLAWYVAPGAYLTSVENLKMLVASLALAERAADAGCRRFVGVGSSFEYAADIGFPSEDSACVAKDLYSASKLSLCQLLAHFTAARQMSYAWARIFYQYGPNEYEARLVPAVIKPLLAGRESRVTAGEQIRDFLHVEDVGRALSIITGSDVNGPINVGSGVPITVRDLCLTIAEHTGNRDLLRLGELPYRAGDPMFVCANTAKLRALGFKPRFDLASGIEHTVNWWRAQMSQPQP